MDSQNSNISNLGWEMFQYYRHYAILRYAISISQTFSHVNNIAYAIRISISLYAEDQPQPLKY